MSDFKAPYIFWVDSIDFYQGVNFKKAAGGGNV